METYRDVIQDNTRHIIINFVLHNVLKMLTNAVNLDGLFSYLLYAERYIPDGEEEVHYRIKTRTDGNDTCRSVAGCFADKYVAPNMKEIVDRINEFEEMD